MTVTEELSADVLVAGGGVGGLMAALRAQLSGARVVLLSGTPGASNRISSLNTALGEVPEDAPAALFNDVVRAGGAINNLEVVAAMSERIGAETRFLESLGIPFYHQHGELARRQAAGTTWTRAVYSLGMVGVDISKEIRRRLKAAGSQVTAIPHGLLLQLLVEDGRVAGGLVLGEDKRPVTIHAPAVVLATGGAGQLFGYTTNPPGSRGIGYTLALEAGASLIDMEFISFEPFVTAGPPHMRGRDLPTTVLREGARLRNGRGDEFLDTGSAPSKDVICRAMVGEVRAGRGTPGGAVYYDIREMEPGIVARYVQIEQVLRGLQLTPAQGLIEVMPAQHYLMGGVRIDGRGASDVPGLYAVGEVAGGAHGAHRLAAAGGTEVVAMGAIAGEAAAAHALANRIRSPGRALQPQPALLPTSLDPSDRQRLVRIRSALDGGCGILRDEQCLTNAVAELEAVRQELVATDHAPTHAGRANLVALAIARSALARRESRGDHFRSDHPDRDDVNWLGNLEVQLSEDGRDLRLNYQKADLAGRS
ncbi:FAD-binding protein [bacterium]|nr:MAG: FAD-binding protein [bacterium]